MGFKFQVITPESTGLHLEGGQPSCLTGIVKASGLCKPPVIFPVAFLW